MLGCVVWERGLSRTAEDVVGWGQEVGEVWWREYGRWEGVRNQQERAGSSWR